MALLFIYSCRTANIGGRTSDQDQNVQSFTPPQSYGLMKGDDFKMAMSSLVK